MDGSELPHELLAQLAAEVKVDPVLIIGKPPFTGVSVLNKDSASSGLIWVRDLTNQTMWNFRRKLNVLEDVVFSMEHE